MSAQREYEVTWGMVYEADNHEDAVRQALGDLAQVIALPSEGPNIFLVRETRDHPVDENFITVYAEDVDVTTIKEF